MQVEIEVEDDLLAEAWVLMGGDPSLVQLVEVALHAFIASQLARRSMAADWSGAGSSLSLPS